MKRAFGTATAGKGAVYAWDDNKDIGQGSMEIAESVTPSRVAIKLDFVRPFEVHNDVEFTLQPKGEQTQVTWAMQGHTPYFAKIIHIVLRHGPHGRAGLRGRAGRPQGRCGTLTAQRHWTARESG